MVVNRKVTGRAFSMPAGIGIGLAMAAVITIAGTMLTAWLVSGERISEEQIGYGVMASQLAASAAGAGTAASLIKHQKIAVCLMTGVTYYITLILVNLLCFGGQFQGLGVTALLILAGSAAAAFICLRREGKINKRRFRRRTG